MAETIADYVARLGLQVDKAQEQRFNSALGNLGKTLATMAAGLAAAATAIQATVVAVSKSFDNLYFAAQRTNSTVAGIKALSYAFSQIGSSGGEAQSALEGLAKSLRTNPGIAGWLNAQGVATAGRKTEDVLGDAIQKFSKAPYYIGAQFAQLIGIPEETFQKASTQWEQVQKYAKEYRETQAKFGVDPDKAAKSSNELMSAFRSLTAHLDALLTKIATALQPQLNQMLKDVSAWFEQHQDQIVRIMDQILNAVGGLIEDLGSLAKALEPVVAKFLDMVGAISGKDGLQTAMEALLVFVAGRWLIGMTAAFTALMAHPAFATIAALVGGGMVLYHGLTTPIEDKQKLNDALDNSSWGSSVLGWMGRNIWGPLGVKNKWTPSGASGSPGGAGGSGGQFGDADGTAPDKVTGVDPRLSAAIDAAAAKSPYEVKVTSGFRPGDLRYHGLGMAMDVKLIDKETGKELPNYQDASAFWQYKAFADSVHEEYIKAGGSPKDLRWGGYFSGPPGKYGAMDTMHLDVGGRYEAPMGGGSWEGGPNEEQRRIWDLDRYKEKQSMLFNAPPLGSSSSRLASISNRTSITIFGSKDPAGTAASLGGEQSRVASDLIRNAQSAFV